VRGYNSLTKLREIAERISNDGRPFAAYQRRVESDNPQRSPSSRHLLTRARKRLSIARGGDLLAAARLCLRERELRPGAGHRLWVAPSS
jgi:hypothetical protein